MITVKGIVQGNVVVLPEGSHLPNGAEVEVRLVRQLSEQEAFRQILDHPITHPVGMEEIVAEDKREREERADAWLQ